MNNSTNAFCSQCGTKLPEIAKFCPGCGVQIGSISRKNLKISPKIALIILCLAAMLWVPAWSFQAWKAGKKPTTTITKEDSASHSKEAPKLDPALASLRQEALSKQGDINAQRAYADALTESLRSNETPPQELIFEAIEVFGKILQQNPTDGDALIALADISFEQQVFVKAVDYYARYLSLNPDDNSARARYASSLAFSAKFEDALKELDIVLSKDPKNFHAAAYKAITYAQMGKKDEAIKEGEKAILLAPSDESKERFNNFLTEIKSSEVQPNNQTPQKAAVISSDTPQFVSEVESLIKGNQVAGNKFTGIKMLDADKLQIEFANFPMQAMPPFVQDKFVNSIKEKLKGSPIKTIVFFDSATNQELLTSKLD